VAAECGYGLHCTREMATGSDVTPPQASARRFLDTLRAHCAAKVRSESTRACQLDREVSSRMYWDPEAEAQVSAGLCSREVQRADAGGRCRDAGGEQRT